MAPAAAMRGEWMTAEDLPEMAASRALAGDWSEPVFVVSFRVGRVEGVGVSERRERESPPPSPSPKTKTQ